MYRYVGLVLSSCLSAGIIVILCMLGGIYLDNLWRISPWGSIICTLIGLAGAGRYLYHSIKPLLEEDEKK